MKHQLIIQEGNDQGPIGVSLFDSEIQIGSTPFIAAVGDAIQLSQNNKLIHCRVVTRFFKYSKDNNELCCTIILTVAPISDNELKHYCAKLTF